MFPPCGNFVDNFRYVGHIFVVRDPLVDIFLWGFMPSDFSSGSLLKCHSCMGGRTIGSLDTKSHPCPKGGRTFDHQYQGLNETSGNPSMKKIGCPLSGIESIRNDYH